MSYKLSEGALEVIMSGGTYENPVLQILNTKKIVDTNSKERLRLLVSDGKHSHGFAILAVTLNERAQAGELADYTVIKVDKSIVSSMKDARNSLKRILVIMDYTLVAPGNQVGAKLGNPVGWTAESSNQVSAPVPAPPKPVMPPPVPLSTTGPSLDSSMLSSQHTHPIASLSPYQNKWVIKARVMSKSQIRSWSNARGEGKLFSMDLCDESGEIRATAFKNECDKYYDIIKVDKVYYISRCQLKTANKKFCTLRNDYEMTFTNETVVAECMEDSSNMPTIHYDFVPINEISSKVADAIIDVIGVSKAASDLQELTAKSTGKLLKKREVTLVDSSGGAVTLTLWGSEAETFDGSSNPVILAKGTRIAEFNGSKSLSMLSGTVLRYNPDIPEAHKLRGWYDHGGANMDVVNISVRSGVYSGSSEWITFSEAESRQLGSGDKGDYYSLLGVLTFTFKDNAVYKACPQDQCNKKLVDQENGMFRCEKCNREYPNYKYRILLAAHVSDPTGDQRITAFNEAAETMLGIQSAEIGRMSDYDKDAYAQVFEDVKFKSFVFKFRTKMETYSDEARLKTTVISAQPIDYKDANTRLIKSITSLSGVQV